MQKDSSITWMISSFILKNTILIFFGLIILFPFFFMIMLALQTNDEVTQTSKHLIPQHGLHWENFKEAFQEGYWEALLVTLIIVALSIVLKLLVTIMAGYAFAYKKWWGRNVLWYFLISLMMIPEMALMVGQYTLSADLEINYGNMAVVTMVLPFIATIFNIFMMRNAFSAIPTRIKEAALIDGSSEFKYFWKVALPMITPTLWTVVILTVFASWGSYLWPMLLTNGDPDAHKPLGIWLFSAGKLPDGMGGTRTFINIRFAAAFITNIPIIILYFVFRGRVMRAVSRQGSGVKG